MWNPLGDESFDPNNQQHTQPAHKRRPMKGLLGVLALAGVSSARGQRGMVRGSQPLPTSKVGPGVFVVACS